MASRVGCVGCATMVDDVDVRVAVVAVVVVVTSTSQYELLLLLLVLLLGCCAAFSGVQYVKTRSNIYIAGYMMNDEKKARVVVDRGLQNLKINLKNLKFFSAATCRSNCNYGVYGTIQPKVKPTTIATFLKTPSSIMRRPPTIRSQ
jgi:hypothetical protein